MEREEFIGKLQLVYVGDKRASEEIISEYDRLNNINKQLAEECQKLDDKETRLNNIIETQKKELEEWKKKYGSQ